MASMAKGMAKGAIKSAAVSSVKGQVLEQAADENSKLGGFLKKGKAVAEKAVMENPITQQATKAAEDAVSKTFGGGVIGDMVGKHVVGEAKKDPKTAMKFASTVAKASKNAK